MTIKLDSDERFVSYQYAKITCGQEIKEARGLGSYFKGKDLAEIIAVPFDKIQAELKPETEEDNFILYLEWDALRAALALYLGVEDEHIDTERCLITSIEQTEEGVEVAEVIFVAWGDTALVQ